MDFGVYLKSLIDKREYSYRKLATLADIDHTYISKIVVGKMGPPSPEILRKIAGPLGVSYEALMDAAGYLTSDDKDQDEDLTPTPKEEHLTFYRKVGQLSPESVAILDQQADHLLELESKIVARKNAERKAERAKKNK